MKTEQNVIEIAKKPNYVNIVGRIRCGSKRERSEKVVRDWFKIIGSLYELKEKICLIDYLSEWSNLPEQVNKEVINILVENLEKRYYRDNEKSKFSDYLNYIAGRGFTARSLVEYIIGESECNKVEKIMGERTQEEKEYRLNLIKEVL